MSNPGPLTYGSGALPTALRSPAYFLETIAAIGLKVARRIQLNKLMKLMSMNGQGHSLTLVKGHSDFKVKTCFS